MSCMSDLDILARRVVEDGEPLDEVADSSLYEREDVRWAVEEIKKVEA